MKYDYAPPSYHLNKLGKVDGKTKIEKCASTDMTYKAPFAAVFSSSSYTQRHKQRRGTSH